MTENDIKRAAQIDKAIFVLAIAAIVWVIFSWLSVLVD